MHTKSFIFLLLIGLFLFGCAPKIQEQPSSQEVATHEVYTESPEQVLHSLANALHEGRKSDALTYIVLGSQDYYNELFTTIGTTGMDLYGSKLDALGLSSQTPDEAIFTGQWTVNAKTLNVTAILIKTGEGRWKLVEVR